MSFWQVLGLIRVGAVGLLLLLWIILVLEIFFDTGKDDGA